MDAESKHATTILELQSRNFANTLEVLRQLFDGNILTLKSGQRIAMGENMQIGYVFENLTAAGTEVILGDMPFSTLYSLIVEEGTCVIPKF